VAERQDILAAGQPALDELAQNTLASRRAKSPAMHDADAPFVGLHRLGQEARDFLVRLMPVEPVQVGVILDRPPATAQIAQNVAW